MQPSAADNVQLPSEIGIPEAESLRQRLLEVLSESDDVCFDGAQVRRIGLAGLQVLAAAALELSRRGRSPRWASVNPALTEAAAHAGLAAVLGLRRDRGLESKNG